MGYTRDLYAIRMGNRGSRTPKAKYLAFSAKVIQIRNAFKKNFIYL